MLSRLSSTGVGVRTAWRVVHSSHRSALSWGLMVGFASDACSAPIAKARRYSSNERCRAVALALSSSAVSGATSIVIIRWLMHNLVSGRIFLLIISRTGRHSNGTALEWKTPSSACDHGLKWLLKGSRLLLGSST